MLLLASGGNKLHEQAAFAPCTPAGARKRLGPFVALSFGILILLLVPPQAGLVTRLGG